MRRIILTTESGADLPVELAAKHNVQVVPMHGIITEDVTFDCIIGCSIPYEDEKLRKNASINYIR
jgi:fatty acid-binding protein DegV